MFGFKKKKKEDSKPIEKVVEVNTEEVLAQAQELEKELDLKQGNDRTDTLNKLGGLYFKALEYDKAIEYYETSLKEDPKLGIAHKDLMKLYSAKKKQAAENKDTDTVMYYVNKMEELTSISKNSMRSGNF